MPFTNNMDQRSGPTKCWAWSLSHIIWYPASVFAENWLYCVGLLELCGYINVVNFTNCPRTFGGHCILVNWCMVTRLNLILYIVHAWNIYNIYSYCGVVWKDCKPRRILSKQSNTFTFDGFQTSMVLQTVWICVGQKLISTSNAEPSDSHST